MIKQKYRAITLLQNNALLDSREIDVIYLYLYTMSDGLISIIFTEIGNVLREESKTYFKKLRLFTDTFSADMF